MCCLGLTPTSIVAQRSRIPTTLALSDYSQDHILDYDNEEPIQSYCSFTPFPITTETLQYESENEQKMLLSMHY